MIDQDNATIQFILIKPKFEVTVYVFQQKNFVACSRTEHIQSRASKVEQWFLAGAFGIDLSSIAFHFRGNNSCRFGVLISQ